MSSKGADAMQNRQVLFVHGGGGRAHAEDQVLATYLRRALAPEYPVRYPKFSGLEHVVHERWRAEMNAELRVFGEPRIVVRSRLAALRC